MCFNLAWFAQFLITIIIICAVFALIRLWVLPLLGAIDGRIAQTINIILAVVVAIIVIWLCVDLISCALGSGLWLRR